MSPAGEPHRIPARQRSHDRNDSRGRNRPPPGHHSPHGHRRTRPPVRRGPHHRCARGGPDHRQRRAARGAGRPVRRGSRRGRAALAVRLALPHPDTPQGRPAARHRGIGAAALRPGRGAGLRRRRGGRLSGGAAVARHGRDRLRTCRRLPQRGLRLLPRLRDVPGTAAHGGLTGPYRDAAVARG
ncbi:hypothetical protein SBRY_130037 [Actinacidiphila bryophytorum]|uniref:Uncharacterized protein n=1 Tax=Actinacidiphila bryophytorum TaxID=1436133 RepID=A0A9W4E4V7_9ACTN|nr:hypothetical protein SBRY_130037 [Actinacidiphila bryophytorum]